jgi:hypothetical protein
MQILFLDGEPPAAQTHYWLASEHRFKSKVLANRTMIRRNTALAYEGRPWLYSLVFFRA